MIVPVGQGVHDVRSVDEMLPIEQRDGRSPSAQGLLEGVAAGDGPCNTCAGVGWGADDLLLAVNWHGLEWKRSLDRWLAAGNYVGHDRVSFNMK